jgi:hypothetical protein
MVPGQKIGSVQLRLRALPECCQKNPNVKVPLKVETGRAVRISVRVQ